MPLAYPSALDRLLVLRGGVLEPGALVSSVKAQAKAEAILQLAFFVPKHGGTFLSQAGPHSRLALSQAEHRPFM